LIELFNEPAPLVVRVGSQANFKKTEKKLIADIKKAAEKNEMVNLLIPLMIFFWCS
jgi:hypothetical protein